MCCALLRDFRIYLLYNMRLTYDFITTINYSDIIYYQMAQHIALGSLSHKQNRGEFSPTKEVKKLKIQLSDRIFELKKLQEDYAQQKAHLLMQFTHERNQLNSTIRQLKQKLAEQNQHWTNKIDELRFMHKEQLQKINQHWLNRIQQQVLLKMQEATKKYEQQICELKKSVSKASQQVKQKQKSYEKSMHSVRQGYKNQIAQLKQENEAEKQQLRQKMVKDQQLKINAIMHIKNSQQKQHTTTKNLLLNQKKESDQAIQKLEQRVFSLGQQLWSLRAKTQKLQTESKAKTEQLQKLQQTRKNSLQLNNIAYEQKFQKSQQQWKQNINSLNQKWKNQYRKLQNAYEKVTNACAEKERLWEERGNKVLKLYQSREAREEDVKLIEHLEVQLIKKEFQLQREKQELKFCKLELDNMDDIYKRIFHSVKKNHRHSHSFQLKKMRLPGIPNKTNPIKADQQ